ncbi:hypothetical protein UF78_00385 [Stutzerimonas stutzeri]|uniref:Uncharacterized protein n=1 Tax=Stutzerimonas stutzeri TaxID=316 RepID=A0A0D9AWZ1_STUST|nr:hypothetical protein UF78_00385 [Stutzerimonas stutzeri]
MGFSGVRRSVRLLLERFSQGFGLGLGFWLFELLSSLAFLAFLLLWEARPRDEAFGPWQACGLHSPRVAPPTGAASCRDLALAL